MIGLLAALFLGILGHLSESEVSLFGKRYHITHLGWLESVDDHLLWITWQRQKQMVSPRVSCQ